MLVDLLIFNRLEMAMKCSCVNIIRGTREEGWVMVRVSRAMLCWWIRLTTVIDGSCWPLDLCDAFLRNNPGSCHPENLMAFASSPPLCNIIHLLPEHGSFHTSQVIYGRACRGVRTVPFSRHIVHSPEQSESRYRSAHRDISLSLVS